MDADEKQKVGLKRKRQWKAIIRKALIMFVVCFGYVHLFASSATAQDTISEQEIDRYIQAKMQQNHIPGLAVAMVRQDGTVLSKGYGSTADGQPVTTHTPFAVASLSKSFTALAVMQLAEAGRVNLDAPIAAYLPAYRPIDPRGLTLTARQLLHHTSGLTDTAYPDMTVKPQPHALDEVVQRVNAVTLHSDPGKEYHYNNTNYVLLAALVEAVSSERFPDYLQRHLFQPLGMHHTLDAVSTGQFRSMYGSLLPQGHYLLFGRPVAAVEPEWFVEGAAGIVSTADDMAQWLQLQLNRGQWNEAQLLRSEHFEAMHTPADASGAYGMGWTISRTEDGTKQLQHGGILWTYKSEMLLLPEQGMGVVILFNTGLNIFVDYYAFISGLSGFLTDHPPGDSLLGSSTLEWGMVFLLLVTVSLGIRSLACLPKWEERNKRRSARRIVISQLFTLMPCYMLVLLLHILTWIGGGRVLSLQGMWMMMPSVILWLAVASVQSLMLVTLRLLRVVRRRKAAGPALVGIKRRP
ncbi:Protein flp [Paenibacillus solanacearum]|uniref:Protein flp n=1 Tax=Paenibacillus solanacearum TaxID=2048548 RepID=A0A916K3C8_9BACL|nr:serine hydrolase domain-containing protein [Paenibacillus solanacearum]CAG7637942.1 Protein flp [Paenibacillus solanacearum]